MLVDALRRFIGGPVLVATEAYEVSYRLLSERRRLSGGRRYEVIALLVLLSDGINFPRIAGHVAEDLSRRDEKVGRIDARWIVCSDRGGIYLYEALATKENLRLGKMRSSFMVLNGADGTVSLGPGHIDNARLSRAMGYLIDNRRQMTEAEWTRAFEGILGDCLGLGGGA